MKLLRTEVVRLLTFRFTWLATLFLVAVQAVTLGTTIANTSDVRRLAVTPDYFFNRFTTGLEALVVFLFLCLTLLAFLVGTSYVGAHFRSGDTARPPLRSWQRTRVLGTKLGVVAGAVLTLSAAAAAIYVGGFWILVHTAGQAHTAGSGHWADLIWLSLRGIVLTSAAAAFGAALTSLTQRTVVTLGLAAGYVAAWELGVRSIMTATEAVGGRPYLFAQATAWLTGEPRAWPSAGAVLAALLVGTVGVAFAVSHRRSLAE